jgi:hypothetical protein
LSVQQLGTGNVATFRTTTGATALFVNAAGNVGIGTANPSYQFSVATGLGATATPTVQIADTVGPKSLSVIPNASSGVYNAMVATGDTLVVAGAGTTVNTGVLTLAPWSGSSVGARIGGSSNIFGIYSNATTFYSNAVSPATVMTVTNGRVGIGTTSPGTALHVAGQTLSTFPVHLSLYGQPSSYTSIAVISTPAANSYYYCLFPSSGLTSQNWTPAYTNTTRLSIPYTGLYAVKFVYHFFSSAVGTQIELFISKNLNNDTDLNPTDDRLLTSTVMFNNAGSTTIAQTTLSSTAYLTTTDYINFGFYVDSGTPQTSTLGGVRSTATLTLIQRTA